MTITIYPKGEKKRKFLGDKLELELKDDGIHVTAHIDRTGNYFLIPWKVWELEDP